MINIRPVSDLRNKYPEIEELVLKEDEAVYLTKNGYGSMVVMSIEKYSKLIEGKEYSDYIENELDEADKEAETEIKAKPEVEAEEQPEVDEEALREKLKHNLIEGNKKGIITKADMQAVLKKHGAKNLSALPIGALVATAKKFLGDDYDK